MNGEVGILNVGAGDTKLSFDPKNPAEVIRAKRIVTDMLRRGYALLVEVEENGKKVNRRASAFDENTCEYIIADFDPLIAQEHDANEESSEAPVAASETATATTKPRRSRKTERRVPAATTRAIAVGRTAGG